MAASSVRWSNAAADPRSITRLSTRDHHGRNEGAREMTPMTFCGNPEFGRFPRFSSLDFWIYRNRGHGLDRTGARFKIRKNHHKVFRSNFKFEMKPTAFDLGLSCFSIFLVSRAEGWKIDEPKFMPKGKKCLTSATTALYASPWCRRSHEEYRANPRVETFKHLLDLCRNLPRYEWAFRWMMVEGSAPGFVERRNYDEGWRWMAISIILRKNLQHTFSLIA